MTILVRYVMLLAVALVVGGCSETSNQKSISGTVTFDGKPLDKGQITFVPISGTAGPTAGAEIIDGHFEISATGGTFAGKFRVEVTASRPSGRKVPDRYTGKLTESFEQYIPGAYNVESQMFADVKASEKNYFEFSVHSN